MFGNEKNPHHQQIQIPTSNGFNGDLIGNATLAEGSKTGITVNGAGGGGGGGGGKLAPTINTMKSELSCVLLFCAIFL